MLWEQLVTDGHVRAARLRRLQPWILISGLALIWIGARVAGLAPVVRPTASIAGIVQEKASALHRQAVSAFGTIPRSVLSKEDAGKLPPVSEVVELIRAIQKSLDASSDLDEHAIHFKELGTDDLWKGNWGVAQAGYLKSGDFYLVVANVAAGSEANPQPMRWVGAFREFDGKWQYVTLAGPGFFQPPGFPAVRADGLALSLRSWLPDLPEQPGAH